MAKADYTFYLLVVLTGIYRALFSSYMEPVYGTGILKYYEKWWLDPVTYTLIICLFDYNVLHRRVSDSSSRPKLLTAIIVILGCLATSASTYHFSLLRGFGPLWASVLTVLPVRYGMTTATLLLAMTEQTTTDTAKSNASARRPVPQRPFVKPWKSLLFSYLWILGVEYCTGMLLPRLASVLYGRHFLGAIMSGVLALLAPAPVPTLMVPLLLHSFINPHIMDQAGTTRLNQVLRSEGFEIIDRQESTTGYLSVIDNLKDGYRVLRCDHSLLGGEWTRYQGGHSPTLNEPIYAIFVILEAVRLIELENIAESTVVASNQQHALFIGLGIGTSPAAFITHGIATTIVEIDPVVHHFASKHFSLPPNHTSITADAVTFVKNTKSPDAGKYKYIIHDVFTGGTEPLELFTKDMLEGLKSLLNDEGAIAVVRSSIPPVSPRPQTPKHPQIEKSRELTRFGWVPIKNYAGDLLQPTASAVVKTALAVFPSCRLFRETAAPSSSKLTEDLTNMVIFCRKGPGSFRFREPIEADFLGSHARREYLLPRHEIPAQRFLDGDARVIEKATMGALKGAQRQSKISHWYLMRKVLPAVVWENW